MRFVFSYIFHIVLKGVLCLKEFVSLVLRWIVKWGVKYRKREVRGVCKDRTCKYLHMDWLQCNGSQYLLNMKKYHGPSQNEEVRIVTLISLDFTNLSGYED